MLQAGDNWRAASKERRGALRVPCALPATLISTALGRGRATLIDLSQTGCRLRTRMRCHRGDHAVLTIDTIGPRAVIAAWRGDGELGLAFAQPLAWRLVEVLTAPASLDLPTVVGPAGLEPATKPL